MLTRNKPPRVAPQTLGAFLHNCLHADVAVGFCAPWFICPDMLTVRAGTSPAVRSLQCPPFAPVSAVRQPCSMDPAMPAICSGICCSLRNISDRSFIWISKLVPSLPRLALHSLFFNFFFLLFFSSTLKVAASLPRSVSHWRYNHFCSYPNSLFAVLWTVHVWLS